MLILGIETSCDETSVAVVRDGTDVLSNTIASSKESFQKAGGIIPEQAARKQVLSMIPVLNLSLEEAGVSFDDIDAIAMTKGPGLLTSLLVGTTTARLLASLYDKKLIGVHHTLGHLSSTWLEQGSDPQFPLLTLSASGGHTDLWYRQNHTEGELLGRTRDDAAGEAFDKGASMLGLPYPGGPSVAKEALEGDISAYPFPLPLRGDQSLDFSFSGLKTALRNTIARIEDPQKHLSDICASYEHAICAHLIDRLQKALEEYPDTKEVHLVGGVSANTHLRECVGSILDNQKLRYPTKIQYCTDNAAMIAAAGYFLVQEREDRAFASCETAATIPLEHTLERSENG